MDARFFKCEDVVRSQGARAVFGELLTQALGRLQAPDDLIQDSLIGLEVIDGKMACACEGLGLALQALKVGPEDPQYAALKDQAEGCWSRIMESYGAVMAATTTNGDFSSARVVTPETVESPSKN